MSMIMKVVAIHLMGSAAGLALMKKDRPETVAQADLDNAAAVSYQNAVCDTVTCIFDKLTESMKKAI